MIDSSKPIAIGSDFIPPQSKSFLSTQPLTFLFFNWLTLGIYGSAESISKQHKIMELKLKQQDLQNTAADLLDRWERLGNELGEIRERLNVKSSEGSSAQELLQEIEPSLKELKQKSDGINIAYFHSEVELNQSITQLASSCIGFLGQLLANVLTVGVYGVYQNYTLKNRINLLKAENTYVEQVLNRDLKLTRCARFQQQFEEMRANLALQAEIEVVRNIEAPEQMVEKARQAHEAYEALQAEHLQLTTQYTALKAQKVELEQQKREVESQVNSGILEKSRLESENARIEQDNSRNIQRLTNLRTQITNLERDLGHARVAAARATALEQQVRTFSRSQEVPQAVHRMQSQIGPIPPKYAKRENDGKVEGAFGINELGAVSEETERQLNERRTELRKELQDRKPQGNTNRLTYMAQISREIEVEIKKEYGGNHVKECALRERAKRELGEEASAEAIEEKVKELFQESWSDYAKRCNGKRTAAEILKAEFDFAFDELLEMASEENAKIVFNRSAAIHQEVEDKNYEPNKRAVYNFMALDLIKEGELFHTGDCHGHGYALKLNREGVSMRPSLPERVQGYRLNSLTGQRMPEITTIFRQIDDFTPALGDRETALGVDPASAKWIYEQLSEDERGHLLNLLLDPLIPNDNAELQKTKLFMRETSERVDLVRTAYELVSDISAVIHKNFEKKGIFADQWSTKANEEGCEPLSKEEVREEVADQPTESAWRNWEPNYEVIAAVKDGVATQEDFCAIFIDSQLRYKTLFDAMEQTPGLVQNPIAVSDPDAWNNPACLRSFISLHSTERSYCLLDQYQYSQELLGNEGYLFSNLLAMLMSHTADVTRGNVKKLKKVVATYLDVPAHAEKFAGAILSKYDLSVEEYQDWLRGNSNIDIDNTALGEIEIELVAHAFGIRIGCFFQNHATKVNEYGLMVPADEGDYFGPKTKETLYLYKSSGSGAYYGLWPKLKAGVLPEEAERENRELTAYWNAVRKY